MNRTLVLLALFLFLGNAGCVKKTIPQTGDDPLNTYSEDLSKYRPRFEPPDQEPGREGVEVIKNEPIRSEYDISSQMDVVLDTIRQRNRASGQMEGYTILVYSGINEREAGRVRNRLYDIVPDMEASIQYNLPTYFVKIGRFYQQIEAQPLYLKIRDHYPDATIVPEKFKAEK